MVLALIAVLGMLSVSQFLGAYDRAKQRRTIAGMHSIASANGTYFLDNGTFPATIAKLGIAHMG